MSTRTRLSVAIVLASVIGAICAPDAAAQNQQGMNQRAWVTTVDGHELKGTLTSFTSTTVLVREKGGQTRTIPLSDVRRIEIPDGLGNGARNGAIGGALFSVLAVLAVMGECDGACDATAFAITGVSLYTAMGAGIGTFVDAVRVRRNRIYSTMSATSSPIAVAPIPGAACCGRARVAPVAAQAAVTPIE